MAIVLTYSYSSFHIILVLLIIAQISIAARGVVNLKIFPVYKFLRTVIIEISLSRIGTILENITRTVRFGPFRARLTIIRYRHKHVDR